MNDPLPNYQKTISLTIQDSERIGQEARDFRKSKGVTIRSLSPVIKMSMRAITRLEKGEAEWPKVLRESWKRAVVTAKFLSSTVHSAEQNKK